MGVRDTRGFGPRAAGTSGLRIAEAVTMPAKQLHCLGLGGLSGLRSSGWSCHSATGTIRSRIRCDPCGSDAIPPHHQIPHPRDTRRSACKSFVIDVARRLHHHAARLAGPSPHRHRRAAQMGDDPEPGIAGGARDQAGRSGGWQQRGCRPRIGSARAISDGKR